MKSNQYRFEDHWEVDHPIERVWDVLSRPTGYPDWWTGVYLRVDRVHGGHSAATGDRFNVVARGWLPYKLRFTIENVRLDEPYEIEFKASGDFRTDSSRWLFSRRSAVRTHVVLEWNPTVDKPVVRWLSPILRPLFRWNHEWTMRLGQTQIAKHLDRMYHT